MTVLAERVNLPGPHQRATRNHTRPDSGTPKTVSVPRYTGPDRRARRVEIDPEFDRRDWDEARLLGCIKAAVNDVFKARPTLYRIAKSRGMIDRSSGSVLDGELTSELWLKAVLVRDNYDPTRGVKFEDYLHCQMKFAALDLFRAVDHIDKSVRTDYSKIVQAMSVLGLQTPLRDLAQHLGMEYARARFVVDSVESFAPSSLYQGGYDSYGRNTAALQDTLVQTVVPEPEELVVRKDELRRAARALEELNSQQR